MKDYRKNMMKTIKIIGILTAVLCMSVISGMAQTNLSFLTSKSALRAYAVDNSATAYASLFCNSDVPPQPNYGVILPTNRTSVDIVRFFTNTPMPITILNVKDWVWLNGSVHNSDGDMLFYGGAGTHPVLGTGGYFLPKFQMTLFLNSVIPIKFGKSLESAEFLYVDPNTGQTTWSQYLNVYGNKVYWNTDFSGNGYLNVTFKDGSRRSYDLRNGGVQTHGTTLIGQANYTAIHNLPSYQNPSAITDTLYSYQGIGENKAYEIGMTQTNTVNISVSTSEGYAPKGVWYRPAGAKLWQYAPQSGPSLLLPLTPGNWYVVPDWEPSQFREHEPIPWWWYGGGKG